jgi:hypothetical protein
MASGLIVFARSAVIRGMAVEDYPQWLGGTAWAIYWAKMVVISITAVYAVVKFVQLI